MVRPEPDLPATVCDARARPARESCVSAISEVYPPPDTDISYRTGWEVRFEQDEEDTATFCLHARGVPIPLSLTWSEDGETARLQPTAPLSPQTEHHLDVLYSCGGSSGFTWRTSDVGLPVDLAALDGRTWALDLQPGDRWTPPLGELVRSLVDVAGRPLLMTALVDDGALKLRLGRGWRTDAGVLQDRCAVTAEASAATWENPYFQASFDEVTLLGADAHVTLTPLSLWGSFAPDLQRVEGHGFEVYLDGRRSQNLEGNTDLCEISSIVGVACEPCPDGEPYCIRLGASDLRAWEVPGFRLEPVPPEEAADCPPPPQEVDGPG